MRNHSAGAIFPCPGTLFAVFLMIVVYTGCSGMKPSAAKNTDMKKHADISFSAGLSLGGFAENSEDMKGVKGATSADAITGATKTMFTLGVRSEKRILGHAIETGIEYVGFSQETDYTMPSFSVDGKREIKYHQVRIPLTYNFHFPGSAPQPRLIVKTGVSAGYTFSKSVRDDGALPGYDFTDWDIGPTIGISYFFMQLTDGYRGGIFWNAYWGSRVYEDMYHKAGGLGGNSYTAFGIVLRPVGL